jgi:hypothetical protein
MNCRALILSIMIGAGLLGGHLPSASSQIDDMGILHGLLGLDFEEAIEDVRKWNQVLIRNTERLAPAQAAEIRARTVAPEGFPESNILSLADSNYGLGLVSVLFEEDFVVEQINLIFYEERLSALQVLFDDGRAFGDTMQLLESIYGMEQAVPFGSHKPALQYRLRGVTYDDEGKWNLDVGADPVTVWDMGTREALYQPIPGEKLLTGQFWMTNKQLSAKCGN